jgi:hypothetical protein
VLIMILVFAAFIATGVFTSQQQGLGFAATIVVDAYIARTVLVPSVMHITARAAGLPVMRPAAVGCRSTVDPPVPHPYRGTGFGLAVCSASDLSGRST